MTWIKFHEELRKGAKRGLPRATRFIYLELSLEARPRRGVIELPLGMTAVDGVHDLLGGSRQEVEEALPKLLAGAEPMIVIEGDEGSLRLVVTKWAKWNSFDLSTERSRKHREKATQGEPPEDGEPGSDLGNGGATEVQRVANAEGTLLDQIREDQRRSDRGSARGGEPAPDPGPDLIAFAAELAAEEAKACKSGVGTSVSERVAAGGLPTQGQRATLRKIYDSRVSRTGSIPLGTDEQWTSERWREARRRLKLPDGEPERRHVVALWEKAAKSSAETQAVNGWKPTAREIVAHWIRSYLSDGQSHAGGIVDQKHPIALLVARAGETYGMPPKPQRKTPASAPPVDEPPPVRLPPSAEVLAMADATLAKLGAPGRVKRPSLP